MSKYIKLRTVIITLAICFVFAICVKADMAEPGSESDPLVTKSYVDKVSFNLMQYVDSKSGGSASYEIVYMEQNQQLIGDMGTEIILRSGIAVVVDSGNGGLANITEGKDITSGENVLQNHLLIIPRNDGRGVKAKNNNVILLVKGAYRVTK
ncbi:MAG TPA: hypothetical protein GX519_02750 [Thermoanaerobacterales bacterium]|nr:hypothetical protein [Thermoanaerobacterales bacterium]